MPCCQSSTAFVAALTPCGPAGPARAGLLAVAGDRPEGKTMEMLAASPKGTVPVLVLPDGTVIEESRALMDWALDQADPRGLRNAGNAAALIEQNDGPFKHHLDRFKYTDRYPGTRKRSSAPPAWRSSTAGTRGSLSRAGCWAIVHRWRMPPSGHSCGSGASPIQMASTTTPLWRPCAAGSSASWRIPASSG